ncbi:hypothetical protein Slin14017_G064370 [Septoria linicola]|nr:hypothetical protein Slin14017_G064370 [Septoria linicola]
MVRTFALGLVAALGAQLTFAAPTAEANQPASYKPAPYKPSKPAPHKPAPKPKAPVCKNRTSQLANFDDLTGIPGSIVNDIPTPYKGLDYVGIGFTTVISTGTGLQPGISPHSGLNYAAINLLTQQQGTPTLTTYYPGSNIDSFDLESFYFGCVVQLATGAAAVPTACNVQITGYKGSDNSVSNAKQVCSQQFQYNPTTAIATVEQAFSGPVSKNCKNLDFAIVTFSLEGGSAALQSLGALVLDDIKYSTCSK